MKNGLIDLHLHLDGSLSVESVKELAKIGDITLSGDGELIKKLRVNSDCHDLTEYLEKFDFPLSLLQTKENIAKSTENLCNELKNQGLIYAEIRFAPQLHTRLGLSQKEVIESAIKGIFASDFKSQLILCCMRGDNNRKENLETVRLAKDYIGKGVCAVDLAGAEALFPTENFEELFTLAKNNGTPFTIHAGEAMGPESVEKALSYGTKRIGHGVNSTKSEALVKKLAKEKITLELCPTSNLHTCIYKDISEYPLRFFIDAGVAVTVNTDNMTVSGVDLEHEMDLLIKAFGLSTEEIKQLQKNSVNAAFLSSKEKEELLTEVEKNFS